LFEDELGAVAILHAGLVHAQREDQPKRVHDDMTFASVYFLARIVSAEPPFSVVLTD
jgi:hypothetical protein